MKVFAPLSRAIERILVFDLNANDRTAIFPSNPFN
jgi:hypothetical protein